MAHCIAAITSLFTVSVESSCAHIIWQHTATERKQLRDSCRVHSDNPTFIIPVWVT